MCWAMVTYIMMWHGTKIGEIIRSWFFLLKIELHLIFEMDPRRPANHYTKYFRYWHFVRVYLFKIIQLMTSCIIRIFFFHDNLTLDALRKYTRETFKEIKWLPVIITMAFVIIDFASKLVWKKHRVRTGRT